MDKIALFTIAVGKDPVVYTECAEEIMKQIVEKDEKFFDFFEHSVKLSNGSLVSFSTSRTCIWQLCKNNLDK